MSFLELSSRYKNLFSGVEIAHNKTVAFGTTETTMSKWMVAGEGGGRENNYSLGIPMVGEWSSFPRIDRSQPLKLGFL